VLPGFSYLESLGEERDSKDVTPSAFTTVDDPVMAVSDMYDRQTAVHIPGHPPSSSSFSSLGEAATPVGTPSAQSTFSYLSSLGDVDTSASDNTGSGYQSETTRDPSPISHLEHLGGVLETIDGTNNLDEALPVIVPQKGSYNLAAPPQNPLNTRKFGNGPVFVPNKRDSAGTNARKNIVNKSLPVSSVNTVRKNIVSKSLPVSSVTTHRVFVPNKRSGQDTSQGKNDVDKSLPESTLNTHRVLVPVEPSGPGSNQATTSQSDFGHDGYPTA